MVVRSNGYSQARGNWVPRLLEIFQLSEQNRCEGEERTQKELHFLRASVETRRRQSVVQLVEIR